MDAEVKRLLQEIVESNNKIMKHTEPKKSFYILVSDISTRIRTRFNPLIQLDKTESYEMALVNYYYSFPNIDQTNNNFRYSPDSGTTWFDINIPDGSYEITDIDAYLKRIMEDNGHYDSNAYSPYITLEPNSNTLKSVSDVSNAAYKVDFTTANSVRSFLGFNSQIYSEGWNGSEQIVNILNINSLRVTCDIIAASYTNGSTENVIYTFFPDVGPGYKII